MAKKSTQWILELVDELSAPLKSINRDAKLATSIGEDLGDAYDDVSDDFKKSGKSSKKASKEIGDSFDDVSNELKNLSKDSKKTSAILGDTFDGVSKDIKDTGDASKVTGADFSGMVDDMMAGDFGFIQDGLKGVEGGIYGIKKATMAFLTSPIGAALAIVGTVGLITKEFVEYNEQAKEANMLTQQITRTTGDAVDDARIRASAFVKTFDADLKDTLQVAKNNVEAFDISWEEAFRTMENGMIRGGKANDDYMQSLREYPKLFAKNGFAFKDFQRIVNEGIDRGIYDDKLPDAIKEFTLSVTEQTDTTREALNRAFGKQFTDELFANITNGSITIKEALLQVSEETKRVGVNSTNAQILTADLFRGAGEDAGGFLEVIGAVNDALIEEEAALTPLEQKLQQTADANLRLKQAQDEALNSESYAEFSNTVSLTWKEVQIAWYKGVDYVVKLFNWWNEEIITKAAQVAGVIKMAPAIFQNAFADIKQELFDLIGTFGDFGGIAKDVFTMNFTGALEGIKNFKANFKNEWADVTNVGKETAKQLQDVYETTGKKVRDGFETNRKGAAAEMAQATKSNLLPSGGSGGFDAEGNTEGSTAAKNGTIGSGSGSGGGKNIQMTLNFTQNFYETAKEDVEAVATSVIRIINDRLRDAVITVGN
mgnify:CR=1 FL=1|tara:strand:- start:295 stop:2262 length:1968 start_codon:yes stop_codon:yes gene_type:complete